MSVARKRGSELDVGDVMRSLGKWERVVELRAYEGPNAHLWDGKARIAVWPGERAIIVGPNDWIEVAA